MQRKNLLFALALIAYAHCNYAMEEKSNLGKRDRGSADTKVAKVAKKRKQLQNSFKCEECEQQFPTFEQYEDHAISNHKKQYYYTCPLACTKPPSIQHFGLRSEVLGHMRSTHSSEDRKTINFRDCFHREDQQQQATQLQQVQQLLTLVMNAHKNQLPNMQHARQLMTTAINAQSNNNDLDDAAKLLMNFQEKASNNNG